MELPQLRPVSKCGWACFSCCNAVLVAMASVAFSGVWWSIGFWDCFGSDVFYSVVLDGGFCYTSDGNIGEWRDDDCVDFDSSSFENFSDDGDTYEAANGLVQTGFALLIISLVSTLVQLLPLPKTMAALIRFGTMALCALSSLFFFISIASASSTDVTDTDSDIYDFQRASCGSSGSFPNGAWALCLLSMLITPCLGLCVYKPARSCTGDDPLQTNLI